MYKCQICGKKYTELSSLYYHIESIHREMIPKDMSVQQYYYYMKTGKTNGNCVMCKHPTTWNEKTNKYNRFCSNPKCKEEYSKIMKSRMIAKYGKAHLLNDPNKQREMLANRSISGVYEWRDGKTETTYTGSYELDFLKTMDDFFEWDPSDIMMPSPHTYTYKYEGEDKFYIPDVFIPSLNLEIEIKDGGDNPNNHHKIQAVDKEKEKLKDEVLMSQKNFHYVKLTNKNFTNFFDFMKEYKKGFEKFGDENKIPRIFKVEDIRTKPDVNVLKEETEIIEEGVINNLIDKLDNVTFAQNKSLIYRNYDQVKKSPRELQKYINRLIKCAKFEEDLEFIDKLIKHSNDEYYNILKHKPELKDEYNEYIAWIRDPGCYDKKVKIQRRELKESTEYVEEKFEPDKFLVWFDKPIQKAIGGKIKIYHGSSVKIKGDVLDPISINVGATKYSDPRWSTYAWDNREDAMTWAVTWAIYEILGDKQVMYIGQNDNGQTLVAKPDGMSEKEFGMQLIKDTNEFYVYELEIDIKDLEIGSVPTVREYTVSKPAKIVKRYDYKLNKEIIRRCINIVTQDQLDNYRKKFRCIREMPLHRGPILNNILKVGRDPYRAVIRTEIQNGNIKPGVDDISNFKYSINRHFKNNTYNYESYMVESSISYSHLNYCLQQETDELLKKYLDDYTDFYYDMLSEKPEAEKHINEDIKKAIKYIDDLSEKEDINNDMLYTAKWCLGDLVGLNKHSKPNKHSKHTQSLRESSITLEALTKDDKRTVWVGADWHFYTKYNENLKENPNIDKIINNFNKVIKPNDIVIFLGDLYDARRIHDKKEMPNLKKIKRLKGYKIFVKGNHDVDPDKAYYDLGFNEVHMKYILGNVVFTHEPVNVDKNQVNVHGHLHYCGDYWYIKPKSHIDVYTARFKYQPVSLTDAVTNYNDGVILPEALDNFKATFGEHSTYESYNSFNIKLVYEEGTRRLFSMNDISSKIIINEHYVLQKDKVGVKYNISPMEIDYSDKQVIEFNIVCSEAIELDYVMSGKHDVVINSLYNDDNLNFIKETCNKLFGFCPEIYKLSK